MPHRPSLLARSAAGAGLLLAIVLTVNVVRAETATGALLAGAAAVVVAVCALVLGTRPGFEAGLLLGLACVATAAAALLTMTVGMPGPGGPEVGVVQVLLLGLSCVVGLLLLATVRESSTPRRGRPTT